MRLRWSQYRPPINKVFQYPMMLVNSRFDKLSTTDLRLSDHLELVEG